MVFKSELQFQRAVSDLLIKHGWLVYCHPDSRASISFSVPGLPDIVAVKHEKLLCIECKMPGKTPTTAQSRWLRALTSTRSVEVYVWHPEDWKAIAARAKK